MSHRRADDVHMPWEMLEVLPGAYDVNVNECDCALAVTTRCAAIPGSKAGMSILTMDCQSGRVRVQWLYKNGQRTIMTIFEWHMYSISAGLPSFDLGRSAHGRVTLPFA